MGAPLWHQIWKKHSIIPGLSNNIMKRTLNDLNVNKSPITVTFDWENNESLLSEKILSSKTKKI